MKRLTSMLISALLLAHGLSFAQTAASYYFPLHVGSYVTLGTSGSLSWPARTTTYAIDGTDTVQGILHYRLVGTEYLADQSTHRFQVFWLRADGAGNVLIGALNLTNMSTDIDSAMIMSGSMFPNEFLQVGYARSFPQGDVTFHDSVLSITETVGSFTNCLEMVTTHYDTAGTAVFREFHWYAAGVGLVRNVRTLPVADAHTDELVSYNTTGVVAEPAGRQPVSISLLQNFPNPFNPSTAIRFHVPGVSRVHLVVYNVLGECVAELIDADLTPGQHEVVWHATAPSGVYFCRIGVSPVDGKQPSSTAARKMTLVR